MPEDPAHTNANVSSESAPGLSIASLILGIFSLLGGLVLLVPPILAVIFGHLSRLDCKKKKISAGKGMALAGLIMGYISLAPIPVGLVATIAFPAFEAVRATSQEKAITNNLRQIASAAQQFMLETGSSQAEFGDLYGAEKYITILEPVNGESYSELVITFDMKEISVVDKGGKTHTYQF